jgi:hypothetical protein
MKYKFEPFKDRKELFLWASKGEPISHMGMLFEADADLIYRIGYDTLSLLAPIAMYQKAIPAKTKTVEFWVSFYRDEYEQIFMVLMGDAIGNKWEFIKSEKFSTEIEVSE